MAQFSKPVQDWLDAEGYDLDKMTLEELEEFRKVVIEAIDKDVLLDLSTKLLGNGAYGASSHPAFFFYNLSLASDITAESRETTHFMERRFDEFFHGEWWDRTDLHEKFGIKLDPSKRKWYEERTFSIYGDTDSTTGSSTISYISKPKLKVEEKIEEFFERNARENGIDTSTFQGQELVKTTDKILNWDQNKGLYYAPVRYIVRHKVSKPKWKLKTKSGKEIEVTEDHSMIVFRDGKKIKVKPSEIKKQDKILIIK